MLKVYTVQECRKRALQDRIARLQGDIRRGEVLQGEAGRLGLFKAGTSVAALDFLRGELSRLQANLAQMM